MRIHLKERRSETSDVISFIFDLRGQSFDFQPGQYVFYELDQLAFPDERGKRRHFTISNSPTEKGIVMFTTKIRGSGFKETLRQAPLGYELTVETPRGHFVMPEGETRRHVFIAGGIGITPYRSILRYAMDTDSPVNATTFYLNRSSGDIVFREELETIASQMPTFSLVHVLSEPEMGWTGEVGRLTEALIQRYVSEPQGALWWISGPPPMVNAYKQLLAQMGMPEEDVRIDSFTGY